eukprot:349874-Chlamydomonas_euryale.AAC.5
MASAAWNLCLEDAARRARGEADLCWYATDQQFTSVQVRAPGCLHLDRGFLILDSWRRGRGERGGMRRQGPTCAGKDQQLMSLPGALYTEFGGSCRRLQPASFLVRVCE